MAYFFQIGNLDMIGRKIASVSSFLFAQCGKILLFRKNEIRLFWGFFSNSADVCSQFVTLPKILLKKCRKSTKWGRRQALNTEFHPVWCRSWCHSFKPSRLLYIIKLQGKLVYALTDVAVSSIKRSFEVLTNGSLKHEYGWHRTAVDFYYKRKGKRVRKLLA